MVPFALTHPAVTPISETASGPGSWIGEVKADESLGLYLDVFISTILGAIPWQVGTHSLKGCGGGGGVDSYFWSITKISIGIIPIGHFEQ